MIKIKEDLNNIYFMDLETNELISTPRLIVLYNIINKGKIHGFGKSVDGNITVVIYNDENSKPIPLIHYYKFVSPAIFNNVIKGEGVNEFIELALEGAYPSYVEPIPLYLI